MCYYYPDAAKLGGAIMAGEGSTSAPNAGWQVAVYESAASFISGVGSPTHYCAATRTGTASAFGPLIN
ncbi:hypothetical protein TSUD_335640 [Trifolium subterraneum]|uniref:Uncharacterized protein n=1 Tax=Trifolium subterraneum TaxID=3900 RepID=A0A2Z6LMH3_TRISU|nr:hypothetical protein TSUD_335640 [Trifolium subterraneum]